MEALGRPDEGMRFKQQALARNPESSLVYAEIANSCWNQRRYDEAILWANRVLEIDPRHLLASEFLAGVHLKQGDVDQFLAENLRRAKLFGVPEAALEQLRRLAADMQQAYAAGGQAGLARCMLQQIPPDGGGAIALQRAVLHGAVGELDEAFEHLDRALDLRDPALRVPRRRAAVGQPARRSTVRRSIETDGPAHGLRRSELLSSENRSRGECERSLVDHWF